MILLKSW